MLASLLLKRSSPFQLLISIVGTFLGLVLMLCSIQLHYSFSEILSRENDLLGDQYLVIQKRISALNTLSLSDSRFSEKEISALKNVKGIHAVAGFRPNQFQANIFMEKGSSSVIPQFYSDLFFESVPDEFLDIRSEEWKWKSGDDIVPIIVPKDYLNLYNFGFAPGQQLPQLSAKTIGLVDFKIRIRGNDTEGIYNGFIAGFSSRINSILVPEAFLAEANKKFGDSDDAQSSRLIIKSDDPSAAALSKYLQENGYETNEESLRGSKLNAILQTILGLVMVIGTVIIGLSVLNIIQNAQLLISKSNYEIRTLIQLGYSYGKITVMYLLFYSGLIGLVILLAYVALWQANIYFGKYISMNGYEATAGLFPQVHFWCALIMGIILFLNFLTLLINVRRLAR